MGKTVWVVYWWVHPTLGDDITLWKEFETREEARKFLSEVKKQKNFVKADEIKQYKYVYLEPVG